RNQQVGVRLAVREIRVVHNPLASDQPYPPMTAVRNGHSRKFPIVPGEVVRVDGMKAVAALPDEIAEIVEGAHPDVAVPGPSRAPGDSSDAEGALVPRAGEDITAFRRR